MQGPAFCVRRGAHKWITPHLLVSANKPSAMPEEEKRFSYKAPSGRELSAKLTEGACVTMVKQK